MHTGWTCDACEATLLVLPRPRSGRTVPDTAKFVEVVIVVSVKVVIVEVVACVKSCLVVVKVVGTDVVIVVGMSEGDAAPVPVFVFVFVLVLVFGTVLDRVDALDPLPEVFSTLPPLVEVIVAVAGLVEVIDGKLSPEEASEVDSFEVSDDCWSVCEVAETAV